jgi:hypothetical protein
MRLILLFILVSSCTTQKKFKKLSYDIVTEMKQVCLSSEGKGILNVGGSRYSFSFESMWEKEEDRWLLGLDFPLQEQQVLVLDLQKKDSQIEGGLAEKILRENDDVDPKRLNLFLLKWSEYINSIIKIQSTKSLAGNKVQWEIKKHLLRSSVNLPDKNFMLIEFFEPESKFFNRMRVKMGTKGNQSDSIDLELFVRKCLFLPD